MIEFHGIIRGRVQLVMFRDFTQRRARRLGIVGSVQNLQDGTVEIVAQGTRESLEKLILLLQQGSLLSRVDSVQITWRESAQRFEDFKIIY